MAAVDLGSIAATACTQESLALEDQSVEGRGGLRTGALGLRRQPWGGAPEPLCWRLRKPDCGFRGCGGGRLGLLPLQKGSSGLRAGPSPGSTFSRQPSPFSCPAMCPVDLVPFSGSLEEVGSRDLGGGLGSLAGVSGQ